MYKIAISGKANSGKNTVGKLISKNIVADNISFMSFADPIKKIAQEMFPIIPLEHLYGASEYRKSIIPNAYDKNNQPLTVRQLLIDIGTHFKIYNKNIWVNNLEERIKQSTAQAIIVTDLRFINECDMLINNNFTLIKVVREFNNIKINDPSETEQDLINVNNYKFVINNDYSLEKLEMKINEISNKIRIS